MRSEGGFAGMGCVIRDDRLFYALSQSARDRPRGARTIDRELVAAHAPDDIPAANAGNQDPPKTLDQAVSHGMAKAVVDVLKTVYVGHEECGGLLPSLGMQGVRRQHVETASVEDTAEAIEPGFSAQGLDASEVGRRRAGQDGGPLPSSSVPEDGDSFDGAAVRSALCHLGAAHGSPDAGYTQRTASRPHPAMPVLATGLTTEWSSRQAPGFRVGLKNATVDIDDRGGLR